MFESVILIDPGTDLFPIINKNLPKPCLPILNKPLILYTLEFLEKVTKKFYIIGLEDHRNQVLDVLKNKTTKNVEYIGIDSYDGTVASLLLVKPKLTSENIIVTKGDIVTNLDIYNVVQEYTDKKKLFQVILTNKNLETGVIGYRNDDLLFYSQINSKEVPYEMIRNGGLTITKEMDILQLYVFNVSLFNIFSSECFSFKNGLLPRIVEKLSKTQSPVGIFWYQSRYIHQIKTVDNYLEISNFLKKTSPYASTDNINQESDIKKVKEYAKKYKLKDVRNIKGTGTIITNALVLNSIIGDFCYIGDNTKIISSALMDDIQVGINCHIENSIIGSGSIILPGTKLIECKVSPGFIFSEAVTSTGRFFSC